MNAGMPVVIKLVKPLTSCLDTAYFLVNITARMLYEVVLGLDIELGWLHAIISTECFLYMKPSLQSSYLGYTGWLQAIDYKEG